MVDGKIEDCDRHEFSWLPSSHEGPISDRWPLTSVFFHALTSLLRAVVSREELRGSRMAERSDKWTTP